MLGLLLLLATVNEALVYLRLSSYAIINSYILIHNLIWIYIIRSVASHKMMLAFIFIFYLGFSLFCFYNWGFTKYFDFKVFLIGALFYIVAFIFESYDRLRDENLGFFLSDNYTLIFAPMLFFFGFSLLFNFQSRTITKVEVWNGFTVYDLVSYFVNVVYYTILNLYILKQKNANK